MPHSKSLLAGLVLSLSLPALSATPTAPAAPYPAAKAGEKRWQINLPRQRDEARYQVELIIGKRLPADCNQRRLKAELDEETLDGWGYPYYKVDGDGQVMGTMMSCPPARAGATQLVMGESRLIRYNSKLPVVIYAPQDYEVHYRLWTAQPRLQPARAF